MEKRARVALTNDLFLEILGPDDEQPEGDLAVAADYALSAAAARAGGDVIAPENQARFLNDARDVELAIGIAAFFLVREGYLVDVITRTRA